MPAGAVYTRVQADTKMLPWLQQQCDTCQLSNCELVLLIALKSQCDISLDLCVSLILGLISDVLDNYGSQSYLRVNFSFQLWYSSHNNWLLSVVCLFFPFKN